MTGNIGSEYKTVQGPLIRYAEEVGWMYVSPSEAVALGGGGLLFKPEGEPRMQPLLQECRTIRTCWTCWKGKQDEKA